VLAVVIDALPQKRITTENGESVVQEFVVVNQEYVHDILYAH